MRTDPQIMRFLSLPKLARLLLIQLRHFPEAIAFYKDLRRIFTQSLRSTQHFQ
jgi:hypothetical protein